MQTDTAKTRRFSGTSKFRGGGIFFAEATATSVPKKTLKSPEIDNTKKDDTEERKKLEAQERDQEQKRELERKKKEKQRARKVIRKISTHVPTYNRRNLTMDPEILHSIPQNLLAKDDLSVSEEERSVSDDEPDDLATQLFRHLDAKKEGRIPTDRVIEALVQAGFDESFFQHVTLEAAEVDFMSLDEFRKLIASMPQHLAVSENASDSPEEEPTEDSHENGTSEFHVTQRRLLQLQESKRAILEDIYTQQKLNEATEEKINAEKEECLVLTKNKDDEKLQQDKLHKLGDECQELEKELENEKEMMQELTTESRHILEELRNPEDLEISEDNHKTLEVLEDTIAELAETVLCREAEIKKQKAEHARLADELRVQQQACEDLKTSIAQAELNCAKITGNETKGSELHNKTANIYGIMEKFLSEEDGFSELGTNMNLADEMMKAFGPDFEGSDEDETGNRTEARPGEPDLAELDRLAGKEGADEANAKASGKNSKLTKVGSAVSIADISQMIETPSASSDTFSAAVEAFVDSVYTKKTSDLSGSPPRTPESDSKRRSRSKHKSKSRNKSKLRRKSRSSRKSTGGTQSSKIAALNPLAVKVQDLRRRCEKDIRFVNNQLNNVLTAGYTTVIKRLALSEEIFKTFEGLRRHTQRVFNKSVSQAFTQIELLTPAPHRIRYTKKSANNQTDTGEDHPTPHKHRQSFKIARKMSSSRFTFTQILREAMQQTLTNSILRETLLNQKDINSLKQQRGSFKGSSKKELERQMSDALSKQPVPDGHYRCLNCGYINGKMRLVCRRCRCLRFKHPDPKLIKAARWKFVEYRTYLRSKKTNKLGSKTRQYNLANYGCLYMPKKNGAAGKKIAFRFKMVEQVALDGKHIDIAIKGTSDGKRFGSEARRDLRFTAPGGAPNAHEFVRELNARIASLKAKDRLRDLEKRRLTQRAQWIELLVSSYQQKLLDLLQKPVGIAITAEEIQLHRQFEAQQRGARPGYIAGPITDNERVIVHNQIKEALVQATLVKASNKFNHVYPKLCDLDSNLETDLDSKILRREPVVKPLRPGGRTPNPSRNDSPMGASHGCVLPPEV